MRTSHVASQYAHCRSATRRRDSTPSFLGEIEGTRVRNRVEARAPYASSSLPDFNPVEHAWSKLKVRLRVLDENATPPRSTPLGSAGAYKALLPNMSSSTS
jgi:hypothetical protein